MSSNMNIRLLTSSASAGSSASRPSTICRSVDAVGAVDDVDQRVDAADARHLRGLQHRGELALEGGLDGADDLRRGAVHHRDPVGHLGLLVAAAGRRARSDALSGVMWASTSAITCGCSSAMKRPQLGGVGAVQELERHLHRRRA